MLPPQSFITNLLAMRSHYQAHIQQYDRVSAHAQEQLSHVHALLVDEALDNQQFATNLLQMRSHLQATVAEQMRSSANAREQLVHINALLAEQMAMQHRGEQIISMQATAATNNPELTQAVQGREIPTALDHSEPSPAEAEQAQVAEETQQPEPPIESDQASSTVIPSSKSLDEITNDLYEPSPVANVESAPNQVGKAELIKSPFLPQYQRLTKFEAVEKLLQDNTGSILHVNYIVRSLYGNLAPEAAKVEKQRLYETLSKGVTRGSWDRVPDQLGCYTIDLKLVDKQAKSTKSTTSK